ncbi:MAG: sigma-E factor negative regulatory protein [Burkholderiaceae bacterium]
MLPIDPADRANISALLDGELTSQEARQVMEAIASDHGRQADFHAYSLIGDALRGQLAGATSSAFVSQVSARLADEPTVLAPRVRRSKVSVGWRGAIAASVAAVGFVSAVVLVGVEPLGLAGTGSFTQAQAPTQAPSSGQGIGALPVVGPPNVAVLRASLEDPHTQSLLESHGSMITRLRMTQEARP